MGGFFPPGRSARGRPVRYKSLHPLPGWSWPGQGICTVQGSGVARRRRPSSIIFLTLLIYFFHLAKTPKWHGPCFKESILPPRTRIPKKGPPGWRPGSPFSVSGPAALFRAAGRRDSPFPSGAAAPPGPDAQKESAPQGARRRRQRAWRPPGRALAPVLRPGRLRALSGYRPPGAGPDHPLSGMGVRGETAFQKRFPRLPPYKNLYLPYRPAALAHESLRATERLKTCLPGLESLSTQK